MKNKFKLSKQENTQSLGRKRYSGFLRLTWLMLALMVVFGAGCKKITEEPGIINTCPAVVSTDPANGATNVATNKKITATFNKEMDPATINLTTFLLRKGTEPVAGQVTYSGTTAMFTPAVPLAANTVYTGTITTGAKDPGRNALPVNYEWSFNTGNIPTVVSTDPADGVSGVMLDKIITATFSTTMDPSTITSSTYIIKHGTTVIPGVVTYAGMTATFTPNDPLTTNTVYTGIITKAVTDIAGNAMAADYTWSFATGILPTVILTDPTNGAINVTRNKIIMAIFSTPMNATTINTTTFLVKQGTNSIGGTVSYSGITAAFTPTNPLAANTVYTCTITTGATDLLGNSLLINYVWSFTTGAASDDTPPTVISTDPVNLATGVVLNKILSATFSEPMNPFTISSTSFILKHGTTVVNGSVSYSGITALFYPATNLIANTLYTATITTGAEDLAGNALVSNYVWTFTTGAGTDVIAPTVLSVDPANLATGVLLDKKVSAVFSEAMNPLTINSNTFVLKEGANVITGLVSYSGVTALFSPTASLTANTTYTATITVGAQDLAGNALAADYVWSFTTGVGFDFTPPTVILTDPLADAIDVPLDKKEAATFSEMMDPLTISNTTFLLKQGTTPITGVVSYAGVIALFTPSAPFTANTVYTATITTGVKDLAGNAMLADYVWSFTTAGSVIPPSILGTASIYGAFGGNAGVTNQGINTVINGAIGTTAASTLVTGFHDGLTGDVYTETPLNVGLVTGGINSAPPFPGTAVKEALATQALIDATAAYNAISPASKPGGIDPGAGELGGLTLAPGVYMSASGTFNISNGPLTLDAQGDPNAQWFFQTAAGLTVGIAGPTGARSIVLTNGALPKNVYWYVGSAATINGAGGGIMVGTIIANSGVTFSTAGNAVQTVLNGRAISLVSSVTMVNTTINVPADKKKKK
jgi:hypothetical protein